MIYAKVEIKFEAENETDLLEQFHSWVREVQFEDLEYISELEFYDGYRIP